MRDDTPRLRRLITRPQICIPLQARQARLAFTWENQRRVGRASRLPSHQPDTLAFHIRFQGFNRSVGRLMADGPRVQRCVMAIGSVSSTPVVPATPTGTTGSPSSLQQAAAVLTDGSGQYSDADKLTAYNYITANWSSLGSTDSATQAAVNNAFETSPFVQNLQNVQNSFIQSLSTAATSASTSSSGFQAQIAAYKALSPTDQQLVTPVFQGLSGDQWTSLTQARAGLADILDQAGASGELTGGGSSFRLQTQ